MPAHAWVRLIGAGSAAIGVIVTWQQRNRADRRRQWWRRSAWAFEPTCSDDDDQARLGRRLLGVLLAATPATKDDPDIVQVSGERAAARRPQHDLIE